MRKIIVTSTRYNSLDTRAKLALQTAQICNKKGYTLIVVDADSDQAFLDKLNKTRAIVLKETRHTMGGARRQGFEHAKPLITDNDYLVWMEPEKTPLLDDLDMLLEKAQKSNVDILIPSRSEAGFASYPIEQQRAELFSNNVFKTLTGLNLDTWFGPRIIKKSSLHYFTDYKGEYGDKWDCIFIPLVRAIADKKKIISMETNYMHPTEQTAEEQNNDTMIQKRFDQLENLIPAIIEESKKLKYV